MKKATPKVKYSLIIKCPHCNKENDLKNQRHQGYFESKVFVAHGEALEGEVVTCGKCFMWIEFREVEIS